MTNKSYIISLTHSPGLKKEFNVIRENLERNGFETSLLLSNEYNDKPDNSIPITAGKGIISSFKDGIRPSVYRKILREFKNNKPRLLFFYNPHPLNPLVSILARKYNPDCVICLYIHEPYKENKLVYGLTGSLSIKGVEIMQNIHYSFADHVILPSKNALRLFKTNYQKEVTAHLAPLLIPDQVTNSPSKKRKYFSKIGMVNKATGHEQLIDILKSKTEYNFCVISSDNLPDELATMELDNLRLVNNTQISDEEINNVISESYAVLKLDKEITQSGVVPVSFMCGTPIIARDIEGLRQHIQHKKDGYILPSNFNQEDLEEAFEYVQGNIEEMSQHARASYENKWSSTLWDEYYDWLIDLLK